MNAFKPFFISLDFASVAVARSRKKGLTTGVVRRPQSLGKQHFSANRPGLVRRILGHIHGPSGHRPVQYYEQRSHPRRTVATTPFVLLQSQGGRVSGRRRDPSLELDPVQRVIVQLSHLLA